MKFTLAWLRDHIDIDAPLETIANTLSSTGLEVESVENAGARLGAFTVARVVEAKPHPNADKLRVCQVDTGKGVIEVVCGAPNARTGMIGVFAPTGTFIPGTGITLEAKPVRGVVSHGMLCSERELELSEDHDGIIELLPEMSKHLGKRYVDVMGLDDPVFEVKVTPNRPDALGIRGIARDLAAAGLGKMKDEDRGFTEKASYDCPVAIELHFPKGEEKACPAFAGRYVKGVKNGPSPQWLQQRLKAVGLRPINALVDVTNYITFDRGRPLHVYDADKLKGAIHARFGKAGERFLALDNRDYEVDGEMTVIADDSGVLGLGGIMGGVTTGCGDKTVNVLIESAWFDPVRTAATGRRTGIKSDARYRFERGVDTGSLPLGVDLGVKMILDLCGGSPSRMKMAGTPPETSRTIAFKTSRVEGLAGLPVKEAEVKRILTTLGFSVEGKAESLKVRTPSWRPDVHGPADLVEEVVRIAGIDKVPSTPMSRPQGVAHATLTEGQKRVRRGRRLLAGRGMVEAITWSFITREDAKAFGGGADELELANPISSEMTHMRPSLLPGLIRAVQRNRDRSLGDHALFEVGQAYAGERPEQQMMLASGVRAGAARLAGNGRFWDQRTDPAGLLDVKADVVALLSALGIDSAKAQVTRDAPAWYHPGRSGVLRMGPKLVLAQFGELHPSTLKALDVDAPIAAFEVFLHALPAPKKRPTRAKPVLDASDLQPVRRDFAFVLDRKVAAGDVVRAAEGADKALIERVTLFDLYEGGHLGEGKKSVAIEVTLQPKAKTLTDDEIEAVAAKIVQGVRKATGGEIRG
jgi:phenylalanyl-tRNA synthetase beta chain